MTNEPASILQPPLNYTKLAATKQAERERHKQKIVPAVAVPFSMNKEILLQKRRCKTSGVLFQDM